VCHYCFDNLAQTNFGQHRLSRLDLLRNPAVLLHLDEPNYDHLYAIENYSWPLDRLVLDMKFANKPIAARVLVNFFMHFVFTPFMQSSNPGAVQDAPQLLVPVPLSNKRYWERNYNQAQLLCDWLTKATHIPNKAIVKRVKHTLAQSELDKQKRIENVQNAFECHSNLELDHIAIVDDVITTGVTINAVCSAIKKRKPSIKISVWTMAVTLLN
jgi:ComF family protein